MTTSFKVSRKIKRQYKSAMKIFGTHHKDYREGLDKHRKNKSLPEHSRITFRKWFHAIQ